MIDAIRRRLLGGSFGAAAVALVTTPACSAEPNDGQRGNPMRVFANMADLRRFPTSALGNTPVIAITKGYNRPYDAGGNEYFWEPESSQEDDRFLVIRPNDIRREQEGRWLCRPPAVVTPEMAGAVGDGRTDDAPALNFLFTLLANQGGGTVQLTRGRLYRIASRDLYLNVRVTVQGSGGALSFAAKGQETWLRGASGFLLNPRFSIRLGQSSGLRDVFVMRDGLPMRATNAADAIAEIRRWYSEDGSSDKKSIGVTNFGEDTNVRDCMIVGFNTALYLTKGRHLVQNLHFDCANGIEVTSSGDSCRFYDCHGVPYWTSSLTEQESMDGDSTVLSRPGIGYNFHDQTDGHALIGCFALNYRVGFRLSNVGGVSLIRCYAENNRYNATASNTLTNAPLGTVGLLTENSVNYCSFEGCVVVACAHSAVFNHSNAPYAATKPGAGMSPLGLVAVSGGSFAGLTSSTPSVNGLFLLGPHSRGSINDVTFGGVGCPAIAVSETASNWQISNIRLSRQTAKPWILLPPAVKDRIHISNVLDLDAMPNERR